MRLWEKQDREEAEKVRAAELRNPATSHTTIHRTSLALIPDYGVSF